MKLGRAVRVHACTRVHRLARNRARTPDLASYIFHLSWSNAPTAWADYSGVARSCTRMYTCTPTDEKLSKANKPKGQ